MAFTPARASRPVTPGPATLYHSEVMHRRNTVLPRIFHYSTCYWLIDVDRPPQVPFLLRPFSRFSAGDHLGDPARSLAENARELLSRNGIEADRIRLLTCPRVAGHVFNPLSVWYCESNGRIAAVIAEVHNTYGGRHVYLLRPDEAGRDTVGKEFYVSPFLPMGGTYLMRTPPPAEQLSVSIALRQDGATPFVATLTGTGRPATTGAVLVSLVRWPMLTLRTSALIRWQGIRLWFRRVPVQPRTPETAGNQTTAELAPAATEGSGCPV